MQPDATSCHGRATKPEAPVGYQQMEMGMPVGPGAVGLGRGNDAEREVSLAGGRYLVPAGPPTVSPTAPTARHQQLTMPYAHSVPLRPLREWALVGSNHRPTDYESAALTI